MFTEASNLLSLTAWCAFTLVIFSPLIQVQASEIRVKNSCKFDICPAYTPLWPFYIGKEPETSQGGLEMKAGSAPKIIELTDKKFHVGFWVRTLCDPEAFGTKKPACQVGDWGGLMEW
jgi:hypothetical protein